MFAAPSKERSHDGSSQICDKDISKPRSKVKKKVYTPEVSLPPLFAKPCYTAHSVTKPTITCASTFKSVPSDRALSVLELPNVIAQVGPGRAITEAKWTEGPRLMASALGTTIPTRTTHSNAQSLTVRDDSIKVPTSEEKKIRADGKTTNPNKYPLTGTEVVEMFGQKRDQGDVQFHYLKETDATAYRPYDLRVVHCSDAGSEHYIFSPNAVLHVTKTGFGGLVSLAEWYREYVLWTALQQIPFFKNFRLRKTFAWWHKNVRTILFQRKCINLQDVLLLSVPQFRNALHVFTRVIEELKGKHRMPLDDSKTYTLLEFKMELKNKNQECLLTLEKLSQYHAVILNAVREDSFKTHQELQLHIQLAKRPNRCYEPIHLHLAYRFELKKELARSERTLQKLGNFAALVHQMIAQSLVTIIQQDAVSFLSCLKRVASQQYCLFHTELSFSDSKQLIVDPPVHVFQEAVRESLLTAGTSIIQMCDSCGLFLELSNNALRSVQDLTSDFSCINHSTVTGEKSSGRTIGQSLGDMSARKLVLPEETVLMVQSNMVHGCYSPLSKTQLEWQISINDITEQVETEQAKIMQEAEREIQQLCKNYAWLGDVHLFVNQWSPASLESMKGQPALVYEDHIKRLRSWAERISAIHSSVSTSNKVFIIHCTHTKETLGQQLSLIEKQVLKQLVEQMKLHSESLTLDLERATAELRTEPQDLHDLSKYAFMVRETVKVLADMQKRLAYSLSLHDTICTNYRRMTEQELTLEEKMLGLWDSFIPLLKQADSLVCQSLPSMANALDTMFSFLACDLRNIVFKATSGIFLDPSQKANEMVYKLNYMCAHVQTLSEKVEELKTNSENMQEQTIDLTVLTLDVQKVIARKELWQLKAVCTTWLEEWKLQSIREVVVSEAQGKLLKWKEQAQSLTNVIPNVDAVLQETLGILENFSHQVEVMVKLHSPTFKEKHWETVFQAMGLLYVPEKKVTVADVMSQLVTHQKLINKICRDAQTEWRMEQTFQKLCLGWEDRLFQLGEFTLPAYRGWESQDGLTEKEKPSKDISSNVQTTSQHSHNDARFIIRDLETHSAEIENDLMTLSTMLKSRHSDAFRLQLEDWVRSLQELANLLDLFERYQHMWASLKMIFGETSFGDQRVDLLEHFQTVDKTFKELIDSVSSNLNVLHLVSSKINDRFDGNSLCQILVNGLSTMEAISNQMLNLLQTFCEQFPRLWFLSNREMMQLLSCAATPLSLQPFVRKCFKGVRWLEVDCEISNTRDVESCGASSEHQEPMQVLGVFGSLQEHIAFQPPLKPNRDALVWLSAFENQLKLTMIKLTKQCAVQQNQLKPCSQHLVCDKTVIDTQLCYADRMEDVQPELTLLSECPLQCLLVAEEASWCSVVLKAFQEKSLLKLNKIKAHNSRRLKNLGNMIRNKVIDSKSESLLSNYTMMCLRALVQLTMKHAQQLSRLMDLPCVLESSFEWLSLMKYHINTGEQTLEGNDNPTCYVDVLGHHLQYGFEYYGPEDSVMLHTPSTDQAILGIVLALTSYKCGFVSGPSMSGKTKTVVQLGKALGQQVVVKHGYPSMTPCVVQQMLLGSLQTGAWLLLESVDLLSQGVLCFLGQLLVDIHQAFFRLQRQNNQRLNKETRYKTAGKVRGCTKISDPEYHMVISGKSIPASPSYGCVLISSKGYTARIQESLRFATRPIAFAHPDCRIIAEVMLTSCGFSEALPLSHRLVSLVSLAKDFNCLPGLSPNDQSCILGVLQKIISASEMHLHRAVCQREISNESKVSADSHADLTASENIPEQLFERDGEKTAKLSKFRSSQLSVIQGLMEETAIVKAILSVLMPEHKKVSQFYIIFKDTFPLASQFPLPQQNVEEEEKNQLQNAVKEELQETHLSCDMEIICTALTLHQALKFSQAVMLIGPSGSGKTTCYSVLAGAFNRLASKEVRYVFENENMTKRDASQADPQISAMNWCSVNTLVLFPNAMSHDELFGCFCEKQGWKDGVIARVLRECDHRCSEICNNDRKSDKTSKVKWLVMDGEPVGKPGWLDYLTTLCDSQDPSLCLSSGETLVPQSHLNLIMETTDLRDASPSAVTRCSLVYFTGTDLWKAVWKSEVDALSFEYKLDQRIVKVWNRLADDLFSATLSLLGQNALTSANHFERGSCERYGLQEIMSLVRILRALLQHSAKQLEKPKTTPQTDKTDGTNTPGTDPRSKRELLTRNLFLVAYIWGFGGHLHSRHWPRFDLLARQVLFSCRYKIEVPDEESVFEHFFGIDRKMYPMNSQLTNSIIPKYGKYRRLLNLMLEANQPVLVAGEPGSGKTTLCKTLLSFDKPHIHVPASPLMSSRDLRIILNSICSHKVCEDSAGCVTKRPNLLLFVDDLHEAPSDVFGKASMALECLRQSISKREILTFDTYSLKSLSSGSVSYLTACCVSGLGDHCSNGISPRLSRLFSIFVLPSLSVDVILSIHSPWLKIWLKGIHQKPSGEDMSKCIITATKDLYHAVRDQFQPTALRPQFMFSHHDLQKVLFGMSLWQPDKNVQLGSPPVLSGPPVSVLHTVHLWMHECMRTFSDRLCSEDERKTFLSLLVETAANHYGGKLADETNPDSLDEPPTVRSLDVHTSPLDTACIMHASQGLANTSLLQVPQPAGRLHLDKGHALKETEPSLQSESLCSDDAGREAEAVKPQIRQHLEEIMARLVYGPESFEALKSVNQSHKYKDGWSYQEQELDILLQELSALMDRKEEDERKKVDIIYKITSKYFVHRQGVSQLLRILRALLIPGGHGVLVGSDRGTGRKTAVRLAAYLTGCQLMEVHSCNENKLYGMLREAGNQTRVNGVTVIVLVHEDIGPLVREELLVAMAHRTYPALYTEEELGRLVSRVTAVKHPRKYLMDSWLSEKNVHVFLLMPFTASHSCELPVDNEAQRLIAQMTKATKLSCCVEVYQPWSKQSLVEVAVQCLKVCPHKIARLGSEDSLSVAMAGIHQSACQYASVFLRAQPFTPRTYMEFIAHFGSLCSHLHQQWQSKNKRVTSALTRLDVMNNAAVQSKQDLLRLRKKVAQTQQREKELIKAVEYQKKLFERALNKCVEEEKKLDHQEELSNQAQKQINSVFGAGIKILKCLNPSDLEEVRHYRDPPDGVVRIMDAICLLFNRPLGWESAKQLLGQSNFFQELEFFDRGSLTEEQLQQLGQIVHSPQFVPDSVREVSKACESLCQWVQAVYEACLVQHRLMVKQQLEKLAGESRSQLHLARKHKNDTYKHLEDVQLQLQFIQNELEDLLLQLHKAENQTREATSCAEQLEMHVGVWRAACQEAELHHQNIPGDALILAAIMSYFGPFGPDIRTELMSKWRGLCQTGSININPTDSRTSLFANMDTEPISPSLGFPITVTEKLLLPLGQTLGMNEWQLENTPSGRLVVKLLLWGYRCSFVQRWPLLADTEQHLEMSSQNRLITGQNAKLEKEIGFQLVVCADDLELLHQLDQAAEKGWRVLVTHVERAVPSPEFLSKLARPTECCFPGLQQVPQMVHPDFCLFLSTHLPVRLLSSAIHASILARVHVIDLSLGSEEMQELMLTQLTQSQCRELLSRHLQFQNYNQLLQEKLLTEEDAVMDYILQSDTLLLNDSDFLPRVVVHQEEMKKLQTEIKQLSEELDYHESLLAAPRQLMKLAVDLYQALQVVSHLSPAYYFSLHGFITAMREAFSVKGRPLVSYTTGKAVESLLPEIMNTMVLQLLEQYRPCLFKNHFAVLRLLVCLALLKHNQLCSEAERMAFLRGLEGIEHPVTKGEPCESSGTVLHPTGSLPSWIPPHVHSELLCLEQIPTFRGLISSLCASPMQWREYLHSPSSTVAGSVPCRSHSHLSLLQRALLWKTVLPDWLAGLADIIYACLLCQSVKIEWTESPHTGNPQALSRYLVKYEGPIILTMPNPEEDVQITVQPLHLINQLAHCVAEKNEVQVKVISFGALCDREVILSMLDKASRDGHWLVFNNCHLLEHWDDEVAARLSQLISYSEEEQRLVHPCFRLWFVTRENASHCVPAAVRMWALLLVCDSPWDLKEELSCSLQQALSVNQPRSWSANNTELILRCAIFHSVLLQRQTYKYLDCGKVYHWNQEDLYALVDAHIGIASLCHDKMKVLQYVAVNLVHGGHVTDSADLEAVESVAQTCFSTESSLLGGWPHILANCISSCGHFDLSGLLQVLAQCLQGSAVSDPVLLGFSVDVASELTKINNRNLNLLLRASQNPVGSSRSFSTKLNQLAKLPAHSDAKDRMEALKRSLALKKDRALTNVGAVSRSPLRDFLLAEWDDLTDLVSSLISHLQQPVRHLLSFASLLKFINLSQLERRAELLSAYLWHDSVSDPPGAYRLSAFRNARAFLIAVMREAAQVNRKYISDIILQFQVLCDSTYPGSPPPSAVYLCGLELKGASWDTQQGALQDALSPEPFSMPLLCVTAQVRSSDSATDTLSCKSSYVMNTGNVDAAGVSSLTGPQLPTYHCPLYFDEERQSGNWALTDVNIITKVPLPSKLKPVLCSLRRVRLVSTL
ncbi:dynein heavy chain domain-containing protein 1 [Leuresthes tenuis]|uniref:dynein heavy chain domain-containing protein 1 n=1 Tax=Leuresthes tenuis TaxID=355514 RepID=UPI003B508D77